MRLLSDVLPRLREPRPDGEGGYFAFCPCHNDGAKRGRRSLHVSPGRDGKPVLHCFAGCKFEDIMRAIGLNGTAAHGSNGQRLEATYDYLDATGKRLYQVLRYATSSGKAFKQRRPDGNGGWIWNTKGVDRVPYRLPEVMQAIQDGQTVYVVEGEKCVEALRAIGLVATCNDGGAGKWRSEHAKHLQGADVVVLPDNDEPGRKHAEEVAQSLNGVATRIRLVELPGLPDKGDIADWLAAGHTRQELEAIVEAAPPWTPAAEPKPTCEVGINLTDTGNAKRFAADHAGRVLYVFPWRSWLIYTGQRWERDTAGEIYRLAQQTVARMYAEASQAGSKEERETLARHALKTESAKKIRDMLELARAHLAARPDDFDRDPLLFNLANGTLDLRTGTLRPHRPEDRIMHLAPVEFDQEAICPRFMRALAMWTDLSDDLATYLQTVFGYCLTGQTTEHALFLIWGPGQNGKTVLMNTVANLFGSYAQRIPAESLLARYDAGIPNDIARLKGARLVSAMESEANRALAESLVKMLTGGDRIVARFLHQEFFEFKPEFKLFLSTNHKPRIRGTDHAIWRRIRLIPFTVQIPQADLDRYLEEKLKAEASGILNWLIEGCLRWQNEGLDDAPEVKEATRSYREEQDVLGAFLRDCCVLEPEATVGATELYRAYQAWCEENGEKAVGQRAFGLALSERGFEREMAGKSRTYVRKGLRLAQG